MSRLTVLSPRMLLAAGLLALLSGCAGWSERIQQVPVVDLVQPSAAMPVAEPLAPQGSEPPVLTGSIFQADRYRPLFENHRARIVGDTLQITITEKVSAVQKSTSSVNRKSAVDAGVSALPFLKSSALTRASATGNGNSEFSGNGTTENSNDFSGVITATVVQVLPNGHLVVSAEKQIGVNANVDVLRFSGQVDPRAIAPGNTIASTQIANVRVMQRGRGQAAEAQSIGWLGRFFLNVLPI
ncbi:flagellar basal body L-ring protein FlgH [Pseudaquabacterium pictum]|uniref:Flagellar L-ring protein n=1 Tax=Pseudaquabacterium pictum TaxID=2315236 RepID=A0A480AVG3_9BURK|nr:flagellar basal body L-ring protein FlgH [Rubrivivax pictus]GCL64886.1 flagellar L-ring protein [Rubrivivax pictus]